MWQETCQEGLSPRRGPHRSVGGGVGLKVMWELPLSLSHPNQTLVLVPPFHSPLAGANSPWALATRIKHLMAGKTSSTLAPVTAGEVY